MLIRTLSLVFLMTAFSCPSYAGPSPPITKKTMKAFGNERAFLAYMEKFKKEQRVYPMAMSPALPKVWSRFQLLVQK
ncbi:MAG: hypothetical protein ABI644_02755 [Arenimonas sp.]